MDRPVVTVIASRVTQLLLTGVVIWFYGVEGPVFFRLFVLAAAGFAVTLYLPMAWRLPFFVLLSIAAVFLVRGATDGLCLLSYGVILISLCHLPAPVWLRAILLLVVGGMLAVARAGVFASPWAATVWPILGSTFMFRLASYLRALRNEPRPGRFGAVLGHLFTSRRVEL
ncbi:MAG: hypothetical protein AB7O38_19905 [Pirellulaceae bacterium]